MKYSGRLAVQQRFFPDYRAPFFELLAESCENGLTLFAGQPLSIESVKTAEQFKRVSFTLTQNRHYRDPQSSLFLCRQDGITNWLEKENPAALIVEANPRYLSSRSAIRWMKLRRRPVLGWGLGVPRGGHLIERYFRLKFLRSLDGVIAYSRRGVDEYRSTGLENVFIAHNAVSPRPWQPMPERFYPMCMPLTVLFVGRLQERKRIDILLKACASLPHSIQPNLTIVGEGPVLLSLQSLAAAIYPSANFVGAKHGPDLVGYYKAADLFVLPGTGGLAVQQAMTFGLPVIVAQGDGTQDDLVRPENGWQVPPGDQAALTSVLHNALKDVDRLQKMGAASYRIVAEEINLETMVDSFVTALNAVKNKS